MVLINSTETMIDANNSNQHYISVIPDLDDKRRLFNALHAAQSVNFNDTKIVTMAEHYAKQAGVAALNILVAEDNQVNQQVINGILSSAGHNVRMARTGEEALDILSTDFAAIDMLILDMNMPEVSGVEVVKSLRFMDTSGEMPVIMVTADATPEARETSLAAGANRFLTKPIDARGLLECIAFLSRKYRRSKPAEITLRKTNLHLHCNYEPSEWYDNVVLHELDVLGDDPRFLQHLLKNFEDEGRKHILNIKTAMEDDYLACRENLHALKGSSTEFGAAKLVSACLEGEVLKPYDIGTDKINQYCQRLEGIFNSTINALHAVITVEQQNYPGSQ